MSELYRGLQFVEPAQTLLAYMKSLAVDPDAKTVTIGMDAYQQLCSMLERSVDGNSLEDQARVALGSP